MKKRKKVRKVNEYQPQVVSPMHLAVFAIIVGMVGLLYVFNFLTPVFAQ